jgi:hypothetical protein
MVSQAERAVNLAARSNPDLDRAAASTTAPVSASVPRTI